MLGFNMLLWETAGQKNLDKKWVLACPIFCERTARVKLELTDFTSKIINNIQIERGLHLFQGLFLFWSPVLEKELDFSGSFIKIIFHKFWP